ncbi:NAD(P)H-binding protein [Kribbella sp. NPDC051586]|uniref:NmrA family NAD(P)-binding protein n=1 Tax=Kribbella sp. NPDC051586 TaxID=3364118 RepID=UPI00378E37CB
MIVVTGATGTVGRPLVKLLEDQGVAVQAVSRSAPDLEGAEALFVHPRAVGENASKLLALAAEKGVRRVVALSAINVDDDPAHQPSRFNGDRNKEVEDAVTTAGLPWVAVRASTFATNTIGMFGAQARAGDVVRAPYANFAESPIHESDLAAVIAHALTHADLDGQRIPVTGPQSLTHQELVTIIGEVIGRPLRFEEVPPQIAARGLAANGLPEGFVDALMARYARDAGKPAPVTDQVERVLGRPARTFAQWVADHADSFRAVAS